MTDTEIAQAAALARCKFSPGSSAKRFVNDMASRPASYEMSDKATAFLDQLAHQYRKQIGECLSVACVDAKCHAAKFSRDELLVVLDAAIEGRSEWDAHHDELRKAALRRYNSLHGTKHAHPYEYATRVTASNRRARHRGELYCRFCGECLFFQVKQPHKLVADDPVAQRHLTICALHVLAGMREPAKPGHRTAPMDFLWQTETLSGDR